MCKELNRERCIELLRDEGILEGEFSNIFRHSNKVNAVSMFIATKLEESGVDIDLKLVDSASLLHDIKKAEEIKTEDWGSHEKRADDFLRAKGYEKIADVILKHRSEEIIINDIDTMTWEEKIVYYADKRVKHDEIVTIEERMRDGFERYSKIYKNHDFVDKHKEIKAQLERLEKQIFDKAGINPQDITEESIKPFLIEVEQ